jgi:hypothetical protein
MMIGQDAPRQKKVSMTYDYAVLSKCTHDSIKFDQKTRKLLVLTFRLSVSHNQTYSITTILICRSDIHYYD